MNDQQMYVVTHETSDHKYYLTTGVQSYIDTLIAEPDQVAGRCWSDKRADAMELTEADVQQVVHGVESVLMVKDPHIKWEHA